MSKDKYSYCKLCKEEITGPAMMCSKGSLCTNCSTNIINAECQPTRCINIILWTLAETYFRKGKGEDVSFEKVWKENEGDTLMRFMDLLKIPDEVKDEN